MRTSTCDMCTTNGPSKQVYITLLSSDSDGDDVKPLNFVAQTKRVSSEQNGAGLVSDAMRRSSEPQSSAPLKKEPVFISLDSEDSGDGAKPFKSGVEKVEAESQEWTLTHDHNQWFDDPYRVDSPEQPHGPSFMMSQSMEERWNAALIATPEATPLKASNGLKESSDVAPAKTRKSSAKKKTKTKVVRERPLAVSSDEEDDHNNPHFEKWKTPDIRAKLKSYGVRILPRNQSIAILNRIHAVELQKKNSKRKAKSAKKRSATKRKAASSAKKAKKRSKKQPSAAVAIDEEMNVDPLDFDEVVARPTKSKKSKKAAPKQQDPKDMLIVLEVSD